VFDAYNLPMIDPTRRRTFLRSLAAGLGAVAARQASADAAPVGNVYIDPRKVLLWESTRKEFREGVEGGSLKAMIVPTGSTEQHNEHLAMINDTASVSLVAQQAALLVYPQVMVATPVPVGISPHWMDRKGTLSLKRETFMAVVFDICESLRTHGVERILVLNGHGGNVEPLRESVPEFARKLAFGSRRTPTGMLVRLTSSSAICRAARRRAMQRNSKRRSRWRRFHSASAGRADYARIKPLLHIKDPHLQSRKRSLRAKQSWSRQQKVRP